jgi:hypothetical protein
MCYHISTGLYLNLAAINIGFQAHEIFIRYRVEATELLHLSSTSITPLT